MVTPHAGKGIVGETVDISARGVAVHVLRPIPIESSVTLMLDPREFPDAASEGVLPAIRGVVRSVRRGGNTASGELLYRIGISFPFLPTGVRARLRALTRIVLGVTDEATTTQDALDPMTASALSSSDRGRELLYQSAFERLESGEFDTARAMAIQALRGNPANVHYRALLHRANAEEALRTGGHEAAGREINVALELLPNDEELGSLKVRIESSSTRTRTRTPAPRPSAKSYLSRLFRKG